MLLIQAVVDTAVVDTAVVDGDQTDNEDSVGDNRAASMAAVNSETVVIEVESESTAGGSVV